MKIRIIILFTFLFSQELLAQKYLLDSIRPSLGHLIKEEYNVLQYADSSANFNKFLVNLDSIYKGKQNSLQIIHIGGSHIQADAYSNKIREYLRNNSPFNESPRGLIFPYRLAGTNNPGNYSVSGNKEKWQRYRSAVKSDSATWGLTGINVTLIADSDTLVIKANHKNNVLKPYYFDKIRLFTDADPSAYCVRLTDSLVRITSDTVLSDFAIREYVLSDTMQTASLIISYSDSIVDRGFNLMGIELQNSMPGVQYTSIGVNGASFESFARCGLFYKQLSLYKPDLFIVSIGTNDAYTTDFKADKYRDYYKSLLDSVLKINPECALLLTVPNDSYYRRKYPNRNTSIQQEIIHKLAAEYNAAVWDFYAIMGGLGSSQRWYNNKLMPRDRIHFTPLGYSIKADLLLTALASQWEKAFGYEPGTILNILTGKP